MVRWRTFQEKYGVTQSAAPSVALSGFSLSPANVDRSAISAFFRSATHMMLCAFSKDSSFVVALSTCNT